MALLKDNSVESTRNLWFMLRLGLVVLALWIAVTERWDINGDGAISIHEVLVFFVRFLAFPVHAVLSVTPASVLHLIGMPDARWPSSALLAVVVGLPLWGVLLIGGLLLEAWLERRLKAHPATKRV